MSNCYVLGLALYPQAVGWCVMDGGQAVDGGVRLFSEADPVYNEERRKKRNQRRRTRRRKQRLERVKQLFFDYAYFKDEDECSQLVEAYRLRTGKHPYELRAQALSSALSITELYIVLYHLAKYRGDFYEADQDESIPIVEQHLRFEQLGMVRGSQNKFSNQRYYEEAVQILRHQPVKEDFKQEYLSLLRSRRMYYEGPGNAYCSSPYRLNVLEKDGTIRNRYMDRLRGFDPYLPEEFKACREAYSVQLLRLMDELNRALFDGRKLTKEEKSAVILYARKKVPVTRQKELLLADVEKALRIRFKQVEHVRFHSEKGYVFTNLYSYQMIRDICKKHKNEKLLKYRSLIDKVIEINTVYLSYKDRYEKLYELLHKGCDIRLIRDLRDLMFHGFYSLSLKTVNSMLVALFQSDQTVKDIMKERGYDKLHLQPYRQSVLQPVELEHATKAMKKSYRQAVRIIKAVEKAYGTLSRIHLYVDQHENREQLHDYITRKTEQHGELQQKLQAFLDEHDLSISQLSERQLEKIKLYVIQDGICMYSQKPLEWKRLLLEEHYAEVDHIIPRSISYDDSLHNKVLTLRSINQEKRDRTPMMYMKEVFDSKQLHAYRSYVGTLYQENKISARKLHYLLSEDDLTVPYIRSKYQKRPFQDHRRFVSSMKEHLSTFYAYHGKSTSIHIVHASMIAFLHRQLRMYKNFKSYQYYGEDAMLCAFASHTSLPALLNDRRACSRLRNQVEGFSYRYSKKVEKRYTGALSDDTIHSTRRIDDRHILVKRKDLFDPQMDYAEFFALDAEKKDKLLMVQHDPKTYELLQTIYLQYHHRIKQKNGTIIHNPFLAYINDTGLQIRKYAKKGNGPLIKSFQYYVHNITSLYDISHKYPKLSDKKRIVLSGLRHCRLDLYYSEQHQRYKNAVVPRIMTVRKGDQILIDEQQYQNHLEKRGIDDSYEFLYSFYTGDMLQLENKDGVFFGCYIGCKGLYGNQIGIAPLSYPVKDIPTKMISVNTKKVKKFVSDVLGYHYEVKKEICQMRFRNHYYIEE